jgi:hypothetical protein
MSKFFKSINPGPLLHLCLHWAFYDVIQFSCRNPANQIQTELDYIVKCPLSTSSLLRVVWLMYDLRVIASDVNICTNILFVVTATKMVFSRSWEVEGLGYVSEHGVVTRCIGQRKPAMTRFRALAFMPIVLISDGGSLA